MSGGFTLSIDDEEIAISSASELAAVLGGVRDREFAEIWLRPNEAWPALCALVHGDAAWLMMMRYAGDAGLSTRNPDYAGPSDATITYRLSNGQVDSYPASWSVGVDEAIRAFEYFRATRERAPWLGWHQE